MKKIIFINLVDLENMYFKSKQMGQLSLYNVIKSSELYDVEICDFNYIYLENKLKLYKSNVLNYKEMATYILNKNPTYISIYTMCNNYYQAISLAKVIKKLNSNIAIILAGPQASTVAEETLKCFEWIDYIAIGEGEKNILNILNFVDQRLEKREIISEIKGLAYRKENGDIVENWDKENWCNLDELEPLKFELVDENIFYQDTVIDMEIGRGCPFSCTYCSTSRFWGRKYRVKSVPKVIKELIYYKNKYNISVFSFHHDLLTCDKKYIIYLSQEIIRLNLKISWACYSRLDVIDNEMIDIMAKAGCKQIYYGIETGSEYMQKIINKNLDLHKIYTVIDSMSKNNINAELSFIIGYPEEKKEDLIKTIDYIQSIKEYEYKLGNQFIRIHIFPIMFFPKTKMTEENEDSLVYNPYILENNINPKLVPILPEELNWIKSYKKIFINYYNLSKNISEEFLNLNLYLMMLFNFGFRYSKMNIDNFMQKMGMTILDSYHYFYKHKNSDLKNLLNYIFYDGNFNEKIGKEKIDIFFKGEENE